MSDKRDDAIVFEAYALACQAREIVREALDLLRQMREEVPWYEAKQRKAIVPSTSPGGGVRCGSDSCNGSHSASDVFHAAS
jgi:hypothetical protein